MESGLKGPIGGELEEDPPEYTGDEDVDGQRDTEDTFQSFPAASTVLKNLKRASSEMSEDIRMTFQKLQGHVFHAARTINGMNYMYRYRIGMDGKLQLESRLKGGIYVTGQKWEEARKRLMVAGKAVPYKAKRQWRQAVTGDPDKRIRDHMKETPQVKMKDKFSFTIGVLAIVLSEWLILRMPHLFPMFYVGLMSLLITWRFIDYSKYKYELFLLDFCYFINLSVALQTLGWPDNLTWFHANYSLCMGPICMSIVVWQNSLVFHSLDKVTSYFLHVFPTIMCHSIRWKLVETGLPLSEDSSMGFWDQFAIPLGLYILWQLGYLFVTEVILGDRIRGDKEVILSLRYLANDTKNPICRLVVNMCRKHGVFKPGEILDPDGWLCKAIFIGVQLLYTLVTLLPMGLMFSNYLLSSLYIMVVFTIGIWNGASYYIEIFSTRYNLQFSEKQPSSDRVTKASSVSEETQTASSCARESSSSEDPGRVDFTLPNADEGCPSGDDLLCESKNEDFVEALDYLDLTDPQNMQLYNNILEQMVMDDDDDDHDDQNNSDNEQRRRQCPKPSPDSPKDHVE